MDSGFIITPVAGAVIGYFTNWLAIKMLFRPYKEKRLFGLRLPFTPGLIPKEKDRIARSLGSAVGSELLTNDTIIESLTKENVLESIDSIMDKAFESVKLSYLTVDDAAGKIFGDKWPDISASMSGVICEKLTEFASSQTCRIAACEIVNGNIKRILSKRVEELPLDIITAHLNEILLSASKELVSSGKAAEAVEKSVWGFLTSLQNDERKISELVTFSAADEFKDYMSLKAPEIAKSLLALTEIPQVEGFLKDKLAAALSNYSGPIIGMFIKPDEIYVNIIEGITNYFSDPDNIPEIEEQVSLACDKLMDNTVGGAAALVCGQIRENTVSRITSFIVCEASKDGNINLYSEKIARLISENSQKTILDILSSFDKDAEDKLYAFGETITENIFERLSKALTPQYVEEKLRALLKLRISVPAARFSLDGFNSFKKTVRKCYCAAVRLAAPKIIEAFSVSGVVEEKINSFSVEFTEKLILSIAKKELSAITAIGGVLGFVIGLIPELLRLI